MDSTSDFSFEQEVFDPLLIEKKLNKLSGTSQRICITTNVGSAVYEIIGFLEQSKLWHVKLVENTESPDPGTQYIQPKEIVSIQEKKQLV